MGCASRPHHGQPAGYLRVKQYGGCHIRQRTAAKHIERTAVISHRLACYQLRAVRCHRRTLIGHFPGCPLQQGNPALKSTVAQHPLALFVTQLQIIRAATAEMGSHNPSHIKLRCQQSMKDEIRIIHLVCGISRYNHPYPLLFGH